jgi:periplasmic protein TonB
VLSAGWLILSAIVLHVALLIVAALVPRGDGSKPDYVEPVHIQVVEPAHLELPAPAPTPPVPPPVESPRPLPPPPPMKKPVEVKQTPPDPIDLPPPPPTAEPPKPSPRRIVGLSLESTTTGASTDAFAAGNTRMGETSTVAEDPTKVEKLQHTSTPPRRTSVYVPPYPASLRGQGVRGEVGVQVDIDATGQVTRATVTRPSAHAEFNAAAIDAAKRCTYQAATVDGVAVARTIDITVQFQPHD